MQQWLAAGGAAAAQTPLLTPLPQQQLQLPQPAWRLSPSTAAGEVSDGGRAAPEGCGASAGPAHTHYEALAPSPQLRVVAAAAAAPHVLLTAPPICAYHTERFHSHSSNILFYLVDGGGNAALAVVRHACSQTLTQTLMRNHFHVPNIMFSSAYVYSMA